MIALLNPRSAKHNRRIPLSLLTVGAGLEGHYSYQIIDENFENDVDAILDNLARNANLKYVGLTVMPGPQLVRAIAISKKLKQLHPQITIVWGGTFPSIHTETVLKSGYVDNVVLGQGEIILPALLNALDTGSALATVKGIAYTEAGEVVHSPRQEWVHPEFHPPLPYHKIDVHRYLQRTYLGNRTSAYHSSLGCPFKCGFCSVVSIFDGRWLAQSAERVARELKFVHDKYGVDSIEFFDDNFFTSEKRIAEISERIQHLGIAWWGEGRSDTIYQYSDSTLRSMRNAGCRMIFTGAETGSTETLSLMNKGGTQSPEIIIEFAKRIREFDIIPEFSFVFGSPSEDIDGNIERDLRFIKKIKQMNPSSEIVFYVYAPVLLPGAAIFEEAKRFGFDYPKTLDEWMEPKWQNLDLRKKPMTPWIKPRHVKKIRNFERVLNAQFPTVSDLRLTEPRRRFLKALSNWRYDHNIYTAPYEIRFFLSKVFNYRQPEIEGAAQFPSVS
jgi:anaerobic magnesium-protoporphyrin IX monomethyl ester cyclase